MFNIHSGSSPRYMSSLVTQCTKVESRSSLHSSATMSDYVTQRTTSLFGWCCWSIRVEQSTCLPLSRAIYRIIQNQTKNSSFSIVEVFALGTVNRPDAADRRCERPAMAHQRQITRREFVLTLVSDDAQLERYSFVDIKPLEFLVHEDWGPILAIELEDAKPEALKLWEPTEAVRASHLVRWPGCCCNSPGDYGWAHVL